MVISEKWDRKAQKYATTAVPFPFDGKDTYERSIRQPLGQDFNTSSSFRWAGFCAEPKRWRLCSCRCI